MSMTNTAASTRIFSREQAKAADFELYQALEVVARKKRNIVWAQASIDSVAGRRKLGYSTHSPYNMTAQEAVDKAVALAETDETYVGRQAAEAIAKMVEARYELDGAMDAAHAADKWATHGRWKRYSVVPGGHIHTNIGGFLRDCHTLRQDTDVRWAHPVSGDSVEEAIEVYGETLCSHCFPEAPVSATSGTVGVDADGNPMTKAASDAAKAARQAEKDAKTAAKNAKRVIDPATGTDVESDEGRPVKTETAVRNEIYRLLGYRQDDVPWRLRDRGETTTYGQIVANLVHCLAIKQGRNEAELLAEYKAKAAKKR